MADLADLNETTGTTSIVNHRRYDAFGNLQSETNAAVDLVFGFTGKYLDEFTGLQNNLNPWYSPELGRFVSEDPLGFAAGDANLYRYVSNEPITNVDPFGLEETSRSRLRSLFGGAASSNSANASRLGNLAAETGLYSTARHRRAYQGALNVQDALAETIPGAGQIYSTGKAVTGYNPITGKPLGLWEVGLGLLGAVTGVGDDALRAGRGGLKRISDHVAGTAADASKGVGRGAPNNAAHNAANFARYKDELRAAMSKPHVTDAELARYMDELYRPGAQIGSGSTAAAVRHELATGGTVGGRTHSQKAQDMITALQRWLKNNPAASSGDRAATENVIQDMLNALNGN